MSLSDSNPSYRGIAFSGKAGSGKDYFSERVCQVLESCDLRPVSRSFAELLKRETEIITGLSRGDPAFRAETIRIGDLTRADWPDIYVDRMRRGLVRLILDGHIPIVTDVRLRNERELCQSQGLLLVRVDAPYVDRLSALQARGDETWILDSTHPTETDLDDADFDLVVVNRWTPLETVRTVTQIVSVWQGDTELVS
jgi:hypothetical protein